MFILFIEC